jgi:hypothetical protein
MFAQGLVITTAVGMDWRNSKDLPSSFASQPGRRGNL